MPADETYDKPHAANIKVGHLEACHNNRSPREAGYWAQAGWSNRGSRHMHAVPGLGGEVFELAKIEPLFVWVPDRMSLPCGQRKGMAPPGCTDCKELGE